MPNRILNVRIRARFIEFVIQCGNHIFPWFREYGNTVESTVFKSFGKDVSGVVDWASIQTHAAMISSQSHQRAALFSVRNW